MSSTTRRQDRTGLSPPGAQPKSARSPSRSSRSASSPSVHSFQDEKTETTSSVPGPSDSLHGITSFVPRPRQAKASAEKVHDEWAKVFSKWPAMQNQFHDQLVDESRNVNCTKLSRIAFLLRLSRDPEQDDQLRPLETFVRDEDGHIAIDIDKSSPSPGEDRNCQQPRGFVDHQIWLAGFARPLTIPEQSYNILSPFQLEAALRPQQPIHVSAGHPDSFYRRLVYIGDPDPVAVTALVKQATISQSWALGVLFRGYFSTSPIFRLQVQVVSMPAKVANIIFHMPYLTLCRERRVDMRRIGLHPLRKTYDLSCLMTLDPEADLDQASSNLYLNEGMMSVALTVRDDRWWSVTCLNDEFLLDESRLEDNIGYDEDSDQESEDATTNTRLHALNAERNGLQLVDLDHGDPILDEAGGYTHRNPRVYALTVLDKQLEIILRQQEALYMPFAHAIRRYSESGLPRADIPGHVMQKKSNTKIRDALDEASSFLAKILGLIKLQEEEVGRFLKTDLGLDPKPKRIIFKDPMFVGLNKLKDPAANDSATRIIRSLGKIHTLRHGLEGLIETVSKEREAVGRRIVEDLQGRATRGCVLGILHYIYQSWDLRRSRYSTT